MAETDEPGREGLEPLRREIEECDTALLDALRRRLDLAEEVARVKLA
ncbi:MAG: hypothetical protein GF346_02565, partial [Candidatus Eisenbacteria bacterium]|nr:hypothetical protein [Candidatus Latescibacterota bacterium]MBD3301303.1 hypothetical protein [Candidatus Eisenbacteria bacterium]